MRIFSTLFFLSCFFPLSLWAVELKDASNRELLSEVAERMNVGPHANKAKVAFRCVSGDDISIRIIFSDGTEIANTVDIYDDKQCATQVADLKGWFPNQIYENTIFPYCDDDELWIFQFDFATKAITRKELNDLDSYETCQKTKPDYIFK